MSETNNGVEVLTATGGGQAMMAPGGGLSGGKLALATAEADDVLAGKTYYAGDKELKTGTLALADATATESDVASGKTFYAGDKTIKTGNYTPTLKRVEIATLERRNYANERNYRLSAKSIPNYTKLTTTNFAMHLRDFSASGDCNGVGVQGCSLSYNSETGTVSVTLGGDYGYKYAGCKVTVYCYYVV